MKAIIALSLIATTFAHAAEDRSHCIYPSTDVDGIVKALISAQAKLQAGAKIPRPYIKLDRKFDFEAFFSESEKRFYRHEEVLDTLEADYYFNKDDQHLALKISSQDSSAENVSYQKGFTRFINGPGFEIQVVEDKYCFDWKYKLFGGKECLWWEGKHRS